MQKKNKLMESCLTLIGFKSKKAHLEAKIYLEEVLLICVLEKKLICLHVSLFFTLIPFLSILPPLNKSKVICLQFDHKRTRSSKSKN